MTTFEKLRRRVQERGIVYSLRGKAAMLSARRRRTGFGRRRRKKLTLVRRSSG